jgi:hypothetical protein
MRAASQYSKIMALSRQTRSQARAWPNNRRGYAQQIALGKVRL